eukprot:763017-Hanusia_phi.AAC.5
MLESDCFQRAMYLLARGGGGGDDDDDREELHSVHLNLRKNQKLAITCIDRNAVPLISAGKALSTQKVDIASNISITISLFGGRYLLSSDCCEMLAKRLSASFPPLLHKAQTTSCALRSHVASMDARQGP